MRMEVQVVAEGLNRGDGGESAFGKLEPRPHPVLEAVDGRAEEMIEELASFAEDPAEGFRHGEDELAVRHLEAEDAGDPVAGGADFALMATRAVVPRLAGEGEEALVAAVGALEPRESGGEVAAAMELAHDIDRVVAQWAVNGAVALFVAGDKIGPTVVDDLPEGRSAGATRSVDGGHDNCSGEQLSCKMISGLQKFDWGAATLRLHADQSKQWAGVSPLRPSCVKRGRDWAEGFERELRSKETRRSVNPRDLHSRHESPHNPDRLPNTKPLVLAGCLHLRFLDADHRDRFTHGVEHFQLVAGLLAGSTRILFHDGGEVTPAESGFGKILGEDDVAEEFVFHGAEVISTQMTADFHNRSEAEMDAVGVK